MRSLAIVALALVSSLAQAQERGSEQRLSSYELRNPSASTLQALSYFIGIENRKGTTYEIVVSEEQEPLLLSLAPQAKLLEADAARAGQALLQKFKSRLTSENYHSIEEVQAWMQNIAKERAELARVVTYGESADSRPLMALNLTGRAGTKPVVMITAATHGDELITTEVLMRLVDKLVAGYGRNERLTRMLDQHDLYFVPVVNPDGFARTRRYDGFKDPNRSYPYPGHGEMVPTPSIAGLIRLFEMIKPVGTLDYHAYGELTMYPWAYTYDKIAEPYAAKFDALAAAMSAENRYTYGPIASTIYVAPASSADYYFWKTNATSFAIEMGHDKIPDPSEFPSYVQATEESLWKFIESF